MLAKRLFLTHQWTCHRQIQVCPINKLKGGKKELTRKRHLQGFYHLAREQNRVSRKQLQMYPQGQHCTRNTTNVSGLAPRCSRPPPCEGESPSMWHSLSLLDRLFHKQSHYPTSSVWQPVRPEKSMGAKIVHFSCHIHLTQYLCKHWHPIS